MKGELNSYTVQFRAEHEGGRFATIEAYRVEGWAHDYAFFGDADDLRGPTDVFPRETVQRVWKNTPPAGEAKQMQHWVEYMADEEAGRTGPFPTRAEALKHGHEQFGTSTSWRVVTE